MPIDAPHFRRLERMYATAPTNEYYGAELTVADSSAEVRVRVRRHEKGDARYRVH